MNMCKECYVDQNRITPLLNPFDCLENHTQYICGTCGGAFVLSMIKTEACSDGIFLLNHWKLPSCI